MDDHMVHRGHAVFDTAILTESYLYQLDQHLARFVRSARRANIPLPMSVEQMRRTILDTTAASCKINGARVGWGCRVCVWLLGQGRGRACRRRAADALLMCVQDCAGLKCTAGAARRGRQSAQPSLTQSVAACHLRPAPQGLCGTCCRRGAAGLGCRATSASARPST